MKQIIVLIAVLAVAFGAWKFWPQIQKMVGEAADGNGGGGNQVAGDDFKSGKTASLSKKTETARTTKDTQPQDPKKESNPSPTTFTPEFALEFKVDDMENLFIAGHTNFPAGVEVRLSVILDNGLVYPMKPNIIDAEGEFKILADDLRSIQPGLWIIRFGVCSIDQSEVGQRVFGSQFELIKSKYLKKDSVEGVVLVAFAKLDVRKIKVRRGLSIKLKFSERMPTFR